MSRRRWKKKQGVWAAMVGVAFLVGGLMSFDRAVSRLPLQVQGLDVLGIRALRSPELKQLSGIQQGDPMLGRWVEKAMDKIKTNPRIQNVTVARSVTGKVEIQVRERTPRALANFKSLRYVDNEGNVMDEANTASPEALDLVVLTGPWSKKEPSAEVSSVLIDGLTLLQEIVEAGIPEKSISEIHLDPKIGWSVYRVGQGARIVFGRDRFEVKAPRLKRVLGDFSKRETSIREIDLDFEKRVVVKLKGVAKERGETWQKETT